MSFYQNSNNTLILPTVTTRSLSNNVSFYASLSIGERFERLGSGQELDLFGTSVSRTSVKSQMSKDKVFHAKNLLTVMNRIRKKSLFNHIYTTIINDYNDIPFYTLFIALARAKVCKEPMIKKGPH